MQDTEPPASPSMCECGEYVMNVYQNNTQYIVHISFATLTSAGQTSQELSNS